VTEGIRLAAFLTKIDLSEGLVTTNADLNDHQHFIIFDGDDMTIHAVSESMMYSFGIPATLANGVTANRYEFNIGSIFPEINLKKIENVSNGIGYPCTIDTSSLKDDFWFEQ